MKELLQLQPQEVYNKIFRMPYITIRRKIAISAACLNDQKVILFEDFDQKSRNLKIKLAILDLENLLRKKEKLTQK